MFSLTSFALAVTAASSVSGLVVPRSTPPAGWATAYLEPYDTYHTRYLALGCSGKHNTSFFDQCCHPLLAKQDAATALPALCTSALSASSTSPATPTPTASDDGGDDGEDDFCDDDDDGDDTEESSSSVAVTSIPAVTSTPAVTSIPAVTTTPTSTQTHSPTTTLAQATTSTTKTTSPKTTSVARVESPQSESLNTGGFATFFYQNGIAGACGTVHKDSDFIAAIDKDRYGNLNAKSSLCGKQVKITNPANNKSVVVTIADACPTCENGNSIDLSVNAFKQIATTAEGMVKIKWTFI